MIITKGISHVNSFMNDCRICCGQRFSIRRKCEVWNLIQNFRTCDQAWLGHIKILARAKFWPSFKKARNMIILFGKRLCDRMLNTEWSNPVRREVERDLRRWLVVSPWSRWAPESSWCHTAWPAACRWSSQSPRQTNLCRRRSAPTPRAPCRTWYSCERLQVNTENRLRKSLNSL